MNQNRKSLLKTLHILCASLWLGTSASIVLLQCFRGWSADSQELSAINLCFSLLDHGLIIPGALGSLLTGFWICKATSWGFVRYRWVIAKWIGTLWGILVGSALLGPWQIQMVKLSTSAQNALGTSLSYDTIRTLFTLVSSLQVLLLVLIFAVSVRKPWGKRLSGQKEAMGFPQKSGPDHFPAFCSNSTRLRYLLRFSGRKC